MIKLKDLPNNTKVNTILLLMPNDIFVKYSEEIGLPTDNVYFTSPFSSPTGYWVKTKETGNRIFPIYKRFAAEILDWKVLET